MAYDKPQLRTILDSDFVMNPDAFKPGRRNDDAVDLSIYAGVSTSNHTLCSSPLRRNKVVGASVIGVVLRSI